MRSTRNAGSPTAAFFLYDQKDEHLDNVSGHLYEYSAHGAKLLHCSGKYNNVYSDNDLRGGGTGEESLDLLLVLHKRHPFPLHPDRHGDARDFMRRGAIRSLPELSRARTNDTGDSFGQFGFEDYYGPGSRWTRRAVLTREGYLVVADAYHGGEGLDDDYLAGPVWHLARRNKDNSLASKPSPQTRNWFDAPAFAHAWWQPEKIRVLLWLHQDGNMKFGSVAQRHSQDTDPNLTCYGSRPIRHGKVERFLSVLAPHTLTSPDAVAKTIETSFTESEGSYARVRGTTIRISNEGTWSVAREARP